MEQALAAELSLADPPFPIPGPRFVVPAWFGCVIEQVALDTCDGGRKLLRMFVTECEEGQPREKLPGVKPAGGVSGAALD